MSQQETVTAWIDRLREGDHHAARLLWDRYYSQLVRLAQARLRGTNRAAADEEDVVLGAFDSFFRAVQAGRMPDLRDRHDLWRTLLRMTERKAIDQRRQEQALRRGGGNVADLDTVAPAASLDPTPDFAALLADQLQLLLASLDDDVLRTLALLKLEGYTNEEIARRLECGLRTVERKLGIVRARWSQEVSP